MRRDDDAEFGGRFWLGLVMVIIAGVLAVTIVLIVFTHVWSTWGFLGAFLCFTAVLLAFAWLVDRRERNRRKRLAA